MRTLSLLLLAASLAFGQTQTVTSTQPVTAGLVRTSITVDLFDFADASGIIDGIKVQNAIQGFSSVTLIVPTCDLIRQEDDKTRPGAPILRGGLRISSQAGFRRFTLRGESNGSAMGLIGPEGLVFEGVAPLIQDVSIQGVNWGQGFPAAIVDLRRDPVSNASCNRPLIINSSLTFEKENASGIALVNRGQEKMLCMHSVFRSDNGVAVLLDTDNAGPGSTMSGWLFWNCDFQSYGIGRPMVCRGVTTDGMVGGLSWFGTATARASGDRRPLQRDAIQLMVGQNKPGVASGIPTRIYFDITCEGAAQNVAQWSIPWDGVTLTTECRNRGVRELFITSSVPGVPSFTP